MKLSWNETSRVILLNVAFAVVVISLFYFPLRSDETLPNTPLIDDSFMYFTIASNIAKGNGISDNGTDLTNGFQPLYALLITPVFILFPDNSLLPLRIIYVIHIFIYLITSYIISYTSVLTLFGKNRHRLSRFVFWSIAILYLSTSYLQYSHLNGLETGLLLLFYSVMWLYYTLTGIKSIQNAVVFGVLLGSAILIRIDVGVFAVCFAISYLMYGYKQNMLVESSKRLLVVAIIAIIITMPWWVYNLSYFNDILPSSGKALSTTLNSGDHPYFDKSLTVRLFAMGQALIHVSFPAPIGIFNVNVTTDIVSRIILLALVAQLAFLSTKLKTTKDYITSTHYRRQSFQFATILLTTIIALCMYYSLQSEATWFYSRYIVPLSIILFVIVISHAVVVAYANFPKALMFSFFGIYVSYPLLVIVAYTVGFNVMITKNIHQQVELIEKHVPADEWVASMESGYVSYIRGRIVNLDGKTNMEVIRALDTGNILPYLDEKNIDWIVLISGGFRETFAPDYDQTNWVEIDKSSNEIWILFHRQD